jgi:hypothetical protein
VSDQTAFGLSAAGKTREGAAIDAQDIGVLHALATRVAELAARPIEQEKRELWYRHNALQATRPLVFCDPENGWNEIITPAHLQCRGELARRWEMALRKEIFWGAEMCDDRVIEPNFSVPHVYQESDWGMHETRRRTQDDGSYVWDAPLKSYANLSVLHTPITTVDARRTADLVALAQETLGDVLSVRLKTPWWWTLGMTWTAINLRGLQQFMLDMFDHPDELHRLMSILRDGHLARLDFLQDNGLLSPNNDGTYVGSGGFGWSRELPPIGAADKVRTQDMWGFAESQETVGVSPAMFEEFIFPYQAPILARFGLNCYGCCEPLDTRWHVVERFPRLRRVSVSPWCDLAGMAEKLGARYIFSWKPRPSDLAMSTFDEASIRAGVREGLRIARNCRVEVIMKDNHTICHDPGRVVRWVRIVREEAQRELHTPSPRIRGTL